MAVYSLVSHHEPIVLLPDRRGLDIWFETLPGLHAAATVAVDAAPADTDTAVVAVVAAADVPVYPGTSCARSAFWRST